MLECLHEQPSLYLSLQQALLERGQRLNDFEKTTQRLSDGDEAFEQGATALRHAMEEKYSLKKWWKL